MSVELKTPSLPESIADATVAVWHKKPGDAIKRDENLVDLETDKVMLEVPAPEDGILKEIKKPEGSTVKADEVLAIIEAGAVAGVKPAAAAEKALTEKPSTEKAAVAEKGEEEKAVSEKGTEELSPAVRRLVAEQGIAASDIKGTGKGGRVTKEDVISFMEQPRPAVTPEASVMAVGERPEKRVPMSRLRARIAERLVAAQHNAAMLTTFNEINMAPVMEIRTRYKDQFEKKHQARLGFMSFFVKATIEALKRFPAVNASIDGSDIIYHGYYDIGIAVSSPRGLVVPVLRDADLMSMSDIEKAIADYATKAKDGKLTLEEMTGGTFTITNGGVFGSLLSTPIINPPQSAILGMHNIVKRPVIENDEIVIRPMMYVALSYDHRIIDGRESVSFLVTIKQLLEDPARVLLDL
jgi:2-oxoglutarate dehydrogenase E2 component (dihydrolipoamide succinyltransferase)